MFRKKLGVSSEPFYHDTKSMIVLTEAQEKGEDAVYHGTCVSCLNLKGNAQGQQMHYCLGCAYSNWSEDKPNRFMGKRYK